MAPKKKEPKPLEEMTDDEIGERLFGKKALKKMKKILHDRESEKPKPKKKTNGQN